ncbi:MAG: ABC transporter substrate-binding protein [Actinomycetota bacterium]|nr:ABC transporter substrate-binding protein [Actinomycetota bacterium]
MASIRRRGTVIAAAAVALLAAACSSGAQPGAAPPSSASSTSSDSTALSAPSGSGSGSTYTIGVLTDLTGLAATNNHTFPIGVAAGVGVAATEGYKFRYVVADTATSPSQALSAAQKLVEQDHVFAVLTLSSLTFAAAPYLTSHGIPVIGAAQDSTEWTTSRNMFSVFGTEDFTRVYSVLGDIYKQLGGTNLASLGYSISPSSADAAKGAAVSAHLAGLEVGYLNASFPFGGTNVGPAALAIKASGADSLNASIETSTEFALIRALRQEGVQLKVALVATGYGGDLVTGGPDGQSVAQGLYFPIAWEPTEMHTAATERLVNAITKYAKSNIAPGYGQYLGYLSVDALVQGLELAGPHPTQASLINALLSIRNYTGAGLFGSHSVGFAMDQRGQVSGADNCEWVVRYSGTSFHLLPGMEPICGQTVPGLTINSPTS